MAASITLGSASAAAQASLRIAPSRVAIGHLATLTGTGLQSGHYYTFVLAVPNATHPRSRAIVQALARADDHGRFQVRVKMPIVVHCGPASILATPAGQKRSVTARFALTGCTASGHVSGPPSPPKK